MSTLFLSDQDVTALHDWNAAIEALRAVYSAPLQAQMVPPRSMARGDGIWLRGLSAVSPTGDYMGSKQIAASPRAQCASYLVSLFDARSMALAALIDGNQITAIRTAATAALAVDVLAPRVALRVAVLGAGFEARAQLQALYAARAIESVAVFSPTASSRQRFADEFQQKLGLQVDVAATPQQALAGAHVVLCAARARDEVPVLLGTWLEPGMTVVSIGSTLPEQREVDVEVIRRAALIVADMVEEVQHDTGDLIAAAREGIDVGAKLYGLEQLLGQRGIGRRSAQDIVLYKSVGSALQDVATAEMLFKRAREQGRGYQLPVSIVAVQK